MTRGAPGPRRLRALTPIHHHIRRPTEPGPRPGFRPCPTVGLGPAAVGERARDVSPRRRASASRRPMPATTARAASSGPRSPTSTTTSAAASKKGWRWAASPDRGERVVAEVAAVVAARQPRRRELGVDPQPHDRVADESGATLGGLDRAGGSRHHGCCRRGERLTQLPALVLVEGGDALRPRQGGGVVALVGEHAVAVDQLAPQGAATSEPIVVFPEPIDRPAPHGWACSPGSPPSPEGTQPGARPAPPKPSAETACRTTPSGKNRRWS